MHSYGFEYGRLYGIRFGAYNVCVAAVDSIAARQAFAEWLSSEHGAGAVSVPVTAVKKATSVGNRPLIVATRKGK